MVASDSVPPRDPPLVARPRASRIISPRRADATVPPPLDGPWAPADTRLDDAVVLSAADRSRRRRTSWSTPRAGSSPVARTAPSGAGRPTRRRTRVPEAGRRHRWPAAGHRDRPARRHADRLRRVPWTAPHRPRRCASTDLADQCRRHADPVLQQREPWPPTASSTSPTARPRYPLSAWKRDLLEHRPNGRLLRYDPADRRHRRGGRRALLPERRGAHARTSRRADGRRDDRRTGCCGFRWHGRQRREVVADLPAYPDNMSAVGDGTYWIALPSPRLPIAGEAAALPGRTADGRTFLPEAVSPSRRATDWSRSSTVTARCCERSTGRLDGTA